MQKSVVFALLISFIGVLTLSAQQTANPTLWWTWTTMVQPQIPAGTQVETGQLDGIGAEEIVAYQPTTGIAWIVWVNRGSLGQPVYCIEQQQWITGQIVKLMHTDTWEVDGSSSRQDIVLIPQNGGPLTFGTTQMNRSGGCYVGG
jgi:hypothetical protein